MVLKRSRRCDGGSIGVGIVGSGSRHRRRCCCSTCRGTCLAVIAVLACVLLFGHHFLCYMNVHLCQPIPTLVANVVHGIHASYGLPQRVDTSRLVMDAGVACERFNASNGHHPRSQWVVLLSTPTSGSTWVQRSLASHHSVAEVDEVLLDFSRACSRQTSGACAWEEYQAVIEGHLMRHMTAKIVIAKIQYDHIPAQYMVDFANWIYCANVAVVHLVRTALVEPFWSSQAMVIDTLQNGGEAIDRTKDKAYAKGLASNHQALTLPASLVSAYVRAVESQRDAFRAVIKYHPLGVRYTEVYYEDLHSRFGESYFIALQAFLGIQAPFATLEGSRLQRLHPGSCMSKVSNWEEVRAAILDTEARRACERIA